MEAPPTIPFNNTRSVFFCPYSPNFTWDLDNTTLAWILVSSILFLFPTTILVNLLAVVAVVKRRDLQKLSNILLSSLAVADLLVGAIAMPLAVTEDVLILRQVSFEHICTLDLANRTFIHFLSMSTLYHLTAIAWERYVAIRKCTDHKAIVTKSLMIKLAIIAWLVAVFTEAPALIMAAAGVDHSIVEIWHIVEGVVAALLLIVISYFYLMVYLGVRKRYEIEINPSTDHNLESKVAKMTGLLTAFLLFSFTPAIVVFTLPIIFPILQSNSAFRLSETLLQLHSFVTPIMYWYTDRRFRKVALELLRLRKRQAIYPRLAVRLTRRKVPLGLGEIALEESPHGLAIPASCFSVRPLGVPHKLDECGDSSNGLQQQQPSPFVITTAIMHSERRGQSSRTRSKSLEANYAKQVQATVQTIRKSRSTSMPDAVLVKNVIEKLHFADPKQRQDTLPSPILQHPTEDNSAGT